MPFQVLLFLFLFQRSYSLRLEIYFEFLTVFWRHSSAPTDSRRICPVAVVDPSLKILRCRNVSESIFNASAIFSQCSSTANKVCGAPKPRNAPLGGVCVMTTFERTR